MVFGGGERGGCGWVGVRVTGIIIQPSTKGKKEHTAYILKTVLYGRNLKTRIDL